MRGRRVGLCETQTETTRVVLLGKEGVGKSAFAVRFLTRRFIGEYDKDLESSHRQFLDLDKRRCIQVHDTAGEITSAAIQRLATQADVFIIIYSITDRHSFQEAKRFVCTTINSRNPHNLPHILLVGNKKDLEHLREVSDLEGAELSRQFSCSFREISVSERDGYREVSEVMRTALRDVMCKNVVTQSQGRKSSSSGWYLTKMKEGIIKRTGSIRKKSLTQSRDIA
ncbi:ras-related and estrogen-regulated growth inhibitor [Nematostella vectensis]|uniref:ras-related and estrogen-regulated growth inhibitor n=1 Tax=Nematostella vectensis TaxID=45351 RepID=UPI0020775B98|nr:ras-related and estrogen-regulated growth inhibitor [Nematostella vectensis]